MSELCLFGDRVAVALVEEKWAGKIALPENRSKMFLMGQVLAQSCANLPAKDRPGFVAGIGDTVLFQINMSNSGFKHDGKQATVVHPCDLIAKLDKPTSDFSGFSVIGNWVLVKKMAREKKTGGILLPDNAAEDPTAQRYEVVQVGPWTADLKVGANWHLSPGQEVVLERNRLNPISVEGADYGYIDKSFVHGVVMP